MQAMFGAGCFWGVEDSFRKLNVNNVTVGYSGGHVDNPTYEQVCTKETGHVEVVLVDYDETNISYEQLLANFFECHNPTHVNRQGPDVGSQYRSAILTFDIEQKQQAIDAIATLDSSDKFQKSIATIVSDAVKFWRAEEYHQQYFEKNNIQFCPSPL